MQDRAVSFFNNLLELKAILRIDYVDDFLACIRIVNRLQIPILGCSMDGLMVCTPIISLDPILRYLKNIHVRPSMASNGL